MFCTAHNQTWPGQSVRRSDSLSFYFLYGLCQHNRHSVSFPKLLFHVCSKKHIFSCSLLKINDLHFQWFVFITIWQWVEDAVDYDLFLHSSLSQLFRVFSLEPAANSEGAKAANQELIQYPSASLYKQVLLVVLLLLWRTTINSAQERNRKRVFVFTWSEQYILVWWKFF